MKKLIFFIILFVLIINTYAFYLSRAEIQSKSQCQVLIKNNQPQIAIINNHAYYLNNPTEKMFINQFDTEQLNNLQQCQKVEM